MEEKKEQMSGLPENAYRELKEGEEYQPMMRPDKTYREVTPWSVGWGLVMAVVFSAAAAFLGLKVGQVFEAAIPIAIIAVGLSSGFKRKNALGENVIIQSIGASSGVRTFQRIQAEECFGRECHHPIYRSQQWCYRGRSHLYPSCFVYPSR